MRYAAALAITTVCLIASTAQASASTNPCSGRLKWEQYHQPFTQFGLWKVISYELDFSVCYKPNGGIVSVSNLHGDATYALPPWTWKGDDSGYPYYVINGHSVMIKAQGTAAICAPLLTFACGPDKHIWLKVTFHDNNTITEDSGVF